MAEEKACSAVGITSRTLRNWRKKPNGDQRIVRKNFTSPKKLTEEEIQQIIERFCALDVCDLSLRQAFYKVLDESKQYFCSVATLYRIFKERKLLGKPTPTRSARHCTRPTSYQADKPNMVWTWDITYLRRSGCTGQFLYAYVIVDLFS